MATTPLSTHTRPFLVTVAFIAAVALSGCSGANDESGSGDMGMANSEADAPDVAAAMPSDGQDFVNEAPRAMRSRQESDESVTGAPGAMRSRQGSADSVTEAPVQAALIKVGAVTLRAEKVGAALDEVDVLVASVGGEIASEETSTSRNGAEVSSRLEVKVPVADFSEVIDKLAKIATLVAVSQSSEDVTAQVADTKSRVTSAEQSITQLRRLFTEATELGDIIVLERELSQREADLEALQAEQRTLSARTTMSTVVVNISKPPRKAPEVVAQDEEQGGFVSGIKSGWDGLVTFALAAAHTLGLVLPLGTLALLVVLVARPVVRRFMLPRTGATTQPAASE